MYKHILLGERNLNCQLDDVTVLPLYRREPLSPGLSWCWERGWWPAGLAEELHPRGARCGLPDPGQRPGDLLHLRRPRVRRLLRGPRAAVPGLSRVSPGPGDPGHAVPRVLPLPQRHHLQPGDLRLRLVVSLSLSRSFGMNPGKWFWCNPRCNKHFISEIFSNYLV